MLDIKRQNNQRCEECCGALMGMECKAGDRVVGKSDKSESWSGGEAKSSSSRVRLWFRS